jgi:hypothetical protein
VWVVGLLSCAVFAGALGYVAGNERQANTERDGAHVGVVLAQHRYAATLDDLARVRVSLRTLDGQVGVDTALLDGDTAQLRAVQADLTRTMAIESAQGSDISDLGACLGGVQQSLNALSTGNQTEGLAALNAVLTPCQDATGPGD